MLLGAAVVVVRKKRDTGVVVVVLRSQRACARLALPEQYGTKRAAAAAAAWEYKAKAEKRYAKKLAAVPIRGEFFFPSSSSYFSAQGRALPSPPAPPKKEVATT